MFILQIFSHHPNIWGKFNEVHLGGQRRLPPQDISVPHRVEIRYMFFMHIFR